MLKTLKNYHILIYPVILYWLICILMYLKFPHTLYLMLSWNVFLAALPLLFIGISIYFYNRKMKSGAAFFTLSWLLFFPNSIYIITDFIHISNDSLVWVEKAGELYETGKTVYNTDIFAWFKMFTIGIGCIYGVILGLESLRLFLNIAASITSPFISWICITAVSLMSGFGVYLGRFLRFNSWDVLQPVNLIRGILDKLDLFALQFTLCFAAVILLLFFFYLTMIRLIHAQSEIRQS